MRHALASVFTAHKSHCGCEPDLARLVAGELSWQTPSGAVGFNLARNFLPDIVHRPHKRVAHAPVRKAT